MDELDRFYVWAKNIRYHPDDQPSMDLRLGGAPQFKNQVVRLLEGFKNLLTDLEAVLSEA